MAFLTRGRQHNPSSRMIPGSHQYRCRRYSRKTPGQDLVDTAFLPPGRRGEDKYRDISRGLTLVPG